MSASIVMNLDEFKRIAKEFLDTLPSATPEEIDAGWNCFAISFLGLELKNPIERIQANALFNIMANKKFEAEFKEQMKCSSF